MLDLIEYRMHKGHVGCRKLSGHLSVDKREEASFFFEPGCTFEERWHRGCCFFFMYIPPQEDTDGADTRLLRKPRQWLQIVLSATVPPPPWVSMSFVPPPLVCHQVLQAFQTDPGVKVLLISLKAGGVALNLTVANHIFLMDP